MDGLTRNIAPHPISMGARTAAAGAQALPPDRPITPAHFMELMRRYNDLIYPGVQPVRSATGARTCTSTTRSGSRTRSRPQPKPSDISHDFHSMYCSLVVEGVVGLTPRVDDRIELQPMAREWPYFAARSACATAATTSPSSGIAPTARCATTGYPEGFSLYIDGALAFTEPTLGHVVYDPATKSVERVS